jgi:hypothetical protein
MTGVAEAIEAADVGAVLQADLVPLVPRGRLRVTYNWLYSALNCDPGDSSRFPWVISKLDETHVSLSPADQYGGMTLYASVRDDLNWYVQVQAPYSADWITAVGRDETISLQSVGGLVVALSGFNGQAIAVDPDADAHDSHTGYRVRSVGSSDAQSRLWFMGVSQVLQKAVQVPLTSELTDDVISQQLVAGGVIADPATVAYIKSSLS